MALSFAATLTERDFDVGFHLAAGQTLAVLGPNGAGKSTLLALLAGLLGPSQGHAELDGAVLFDVHAKRRVLTEPRERGISLLAQEALLFPHLSALENVAFGPRSRGMRRSAARATALGWLERVGVADLARRRPGRLSGGQAQRVALARALAADPALLLLDEPLAALDVSVAPAMRLLLREVLRCRTAVVVTHDPLDALLLADRVLVLDGGRIVESGTAAEVLTRPVTRFGAELAGLNLVPGRRTTTGFAGENGVEVPLADDVPVGTIMALAVRPAAVVVSRPERSERAQGSVPGRPDLDPTAEPVPIPTPASGRAPVVVSRPERSERAQGSVSLAAVVDDVEHRGDLVRVHAATLAADVPPADVVAMGLVPGVPVVLDIRYDDVIAYPTHGPRVPVPPP